MTEELHIQTKEQNANTEIQVKYCFLCQRCTCDFIGEYRGPVDSSFLDWFSSFMLRSQVKDHLVSIILPAVTMGMPGVKGFN